MKNHRRSQLRWWPTLISFL